MDEVKLVVYSENIDNISSILKVLENDERHIEIESFESFMTEDLQKRHVSLIIIENDSKNNGILLFKLIKDKIAIENISILFIGENNLDVKKEILRLGALDYFEKPLNNEIFMLKIKNYLEIGNKISTAKEDVFIGTYSKRHALQKLQNEFEISKVGKNEITLLLVDIDNISQINLILGKDQGDNIIKECAEILKDYLEARDFMYRVSVKKFISIFPNKNISDVLKIGNRILEDFEEVSEKYGIHISITGAIETLDELDRDVDYFLDNILRRLEVGKLKEKGKIYIEDIQNIDFVKKNILILNQDKVMLNILSSRYMSKGFNVFSVEDIDDAYEILENDSIDLMITDYIIGGLRGAQIIKSIKNTYNNIKILVFSSQRNENVLEEVLKSGADDYVEKPFSPIELDARVRRLMEQW